MSRLRPPVVRWRVVRGHVWWQHRWPADTIWGWLPRFTSNNISTFGSPSVTDD